MKKINGWFRWVVIATILAGEGGCHWPLLPPPISTPTPGDKLPIATQTGRLPTLTVGPLVTLQPPASDTPTATASTGPLTPRPPGTSPVQGTVQLQDGRCCIGGIVGETVSLRLSFTAQSSAGPVTELRYRIASTCLEDTDLNAQAWQAYKPVVDEPLLIAAINWVGLRVSAQFRDAAGNISPAVCDEISVEGMPAPPTSAP